MRHNKSPEPASVSAVAVPATSQQRLSFPHPVHSTMRTLQHLLAITGLLSLLLCGCGKKADSEVSVSPDAPFLKVAVYVDGRLTVNGTASTIQSLGESLKTLSERRGVVLYYREAPKKMPPPIAMEVMHAVTNAHTPIRFTTHADYSDCFAPDGKLRLK